MSHLPTAVVVSALFGAVLGCGALVLWRLRRRLSVLRAHESRWRGLAETLPIGVFDADVDGRLTYGNRRFLTLLGYDPGTDLTALPLTATVIHPDDRDRVLQGWRNAARDGRPFADRFRLRRHTDGQLRWVSVQVRPRVGPGNRQAGWSGSVADVTAEMEEADRLRRMTEILEATPDLVAMVDTRGRFTYANAAARHLFAASPDEDLTQRRAVDVYAAHDRSRFFTEAVPTAEREGVWSGEVDLQLPDGTLMHVSQVLVAHRRADGSVEYYSSITRDLSERRAFEEQLDAVARFDALTGLPLRATFVDLLGQALDRSRRTGERVSVMVVDLDHFKLINDSMGHDAGDAVLTEVARRLSGHCTGHEAAGRLGSDEFAVISHASDDRVDETARSLGATLAQPIPTNGNDEIFVTASIGIACAGDDPLVTPETLLRDADAAARQAKERGRARVERFVEDYRQTAVHRLRTANDLHRAITDGDLRVAYQPEVDLATGHIVGVEALVRWLHPERGVVPPSEFIPLAEQSGLIADIGLHVLQTAVAQAANWGAARWDAQPLVVWVNLSARQLVDSSLVEVVAGLLERHRVAPPQLGLEITESALLTDTDAAVVALHALRSLGVRLAIDDFGTGFASLSYLKQLPIDAVKIDRSFVDGVGSDGDDSAIVAAVTGMARALHLTTVAEGVETVQQLSALQALGCNAGQGYLFATPQAPRRISRLLAVDRQAPIGRFVTGVPARREVSVIGRGVAHTDLAEVNLPRQR